MRWRDGRGNVRRLGFTELGEGRWREGKGGGVKQAGGERRAESAALGVA